MPAKGVSGIGPARSTGLRARPGRSRMALGPADPGWLWARPIPEVMPRVLARPGARDSSPQSDWALRKESGLRRSMGRAVAHSGGGSPASRRRTPARACSNSVRRACQPRCGAPGCLGYGRSFSLARCPLVPAPHTTFIPSTSDSFTVACRSAAALPHTAQPSRRSQHNQCRRTAHSVALFLSQRHEQRPFIISPGKPRKHNTQPFQHKSHTS